MTVTLVAQSFGELLKHLRRRARLTQRELAQRVGYTEAHVCRLEKNERLPDVTTVAARIVPALDLDDSPTLVEQLLVLANAARTGTSEKTKVTVRRIDRRQIEIRQEIVEDLGALEDVPAAPTHWVPRRGLFERSAAILGSERRLTLVGMAGSGKTILAAELARNQHDLPVFWLTLTDGVSETAAAIIRALALFGLAHGQARL
ncbi:MAG: helix-turn-helix domain-containing protein, partial [Anaerolineales bacterium]|nr:helix-turn-helix domain-containing protein [Anaerolineales bacterium]